ncbi:AAA ATPase [Tieghemiomyces parasiticus]|uniref:Cell division control protein n=1 Tax=Tieghemiomyces parasiticus TaxID=78921 RepID=A0A9W8A4Q7_9FUNG|nr:AAA ATPase [Tieghemiomyces parasiticus]
MTQETALTADPTLPLLQSAKQIFRRAGEPSRLVGREAEHRAIRQFLTRHVVQNRPGSLYISGQPGTGKTASLTGIYHTMVRDFKRSASPIKLVVINCMTVENPKQFYGRLADVIVGKPVAAKDALKVLEALFLNPQRKTHYLVTLDEIDSLLTRDQDILYRLFEWPTLPGSRLTLIGIANALDLTDRFLPRLKAKQCMPELINFNPYQVADIVAIVTDRLHEVNRQVLGGPDAAHGKEDGHDSGTECDAELVAPLTRLRLDETPLLIQDAAVELCARKVAAATGDLRKALDICRQAVELAEQEYLKRSEPEPGVSTKAASTSASPAEPKREEPEAMVEPVKRGRGRPKKDTKPPTLTPSPPPATAVAPAWALPAKPVITMLHMHKVLQSAFGTPTVTKIRSLTFHQKLVLCTAALHATESRRTTATAALTSGRLYESYVDRCRRTGTVTALTRTEFFDLANTLDAFGLLTIAASRNELSRRVTLAVQMSELTHAVADVPLLKDMMAR